MDKKERFQLAKKNVLKRFPKAVTLADSKGKFYVAQDGVDICNKEMNKAVKRGAALEELDLIRQIRPIMLREVNQILRKQGLEERFTKEDRWDCGKSKEMFYIWRNYHHKNSSDEVIARCWNGGPRGYKKQSTEHYWYKVQLQWEN